tara:strand:- start:3779 stop:4279 length:501 start_codon:yes stop_codon:yes gene_type:complete
MTETNKNLKDTSTVVEPLKTEIKKERKIGKLMPTEIKPSGVTSSSFRLSLRTEFIKEDLETSELWENIAMSNQSIQAGDVIEVLREDFVFFAQLIVLAKNKESMIVKLIHFKNLESKEQKTGDFSVGWKGSIRKFAILKTRDGKEVSVKEGFTIKQEAYNHIKNYL